MSRSISVLLLLGLLFCSCTPNDSEVDVKGVNQISEGDLPDISIDEIIGQLPQGDSMGTWDEEKMDYIEHPACSNLRKRLAQGLKMTDAQWRRALLDTGVIRVPNRWPEGKDFALSMRNPDWLGVAEIRMKPRNKGLSEASAGRLFLSRCGTYSNWARQAALCQRLGRIPLGKHKIVFDITIERGMEDEGSWKREGLQPPAPGMMWKGTMSFDVEIVKSDDDCVHQVTNEAIDKAVRNSLGIAFGEWCIDGKDQPTAIFVIDPDIEDYPILAETALSLKIEIIKDGLVVDECHLTASDYDSLALAASVSKSKCKSIGFCQLTSVPAALKDKKQDRKNWSVRVSGTSKDVIYLWDAKRRWSGSVELAVDELIERDRERTKDKKRTWMWTPTPVAPP